MGRYGQASDEAKGASRVVLSGHIPAVSGVGRAGRQVPVRTQRLLVVKTGGPHDADHHQP